VLAPTSALALTLFAGLAFFARHLAETTAPGIIVASEVHLTDELGTTQGGEPIPEAAAVEVAERSGTRVRVRWGSVEGWAPAGQRACAHGPLKREARVPCAADSARVGGVWVRSAAIRPVPSYASVPAHVLSAVETQLADDDHGAREKLSEAFSRFEETQPALAGHVSELLSRPLDETALALGYFLSLAVWLAFDRHFDGALGEVTATALEGVAEALDLDEELRRADPTEAVESDDVVAMEQPHVLAFVHEHVDAALEANADEVDVDDVQRIYRLVLVETLALSYAVQPPRDVVLPSVEHSA
jgi:hypothetical protein